MALDSLELRLASALQRYNVLQRRAESQKEPAPLLSKALLELGSALDDVRAAQEQIVESRARVEQLQAELSQQQDKYWRLFDEMPQPCVVTASDSTIVEVNKAAAQLFNVSQRFLLGKALSVFVCEGRESFVATCGRVAAEHSSADLALKIRPRERAPLNVTAHASGDNAGVRWVIVPGSDL